MSSDSPNCCGLTEDGERDYTLYWNATCQQSAETVCLGGSLTTTTTTESPPLTTVIGPTGTGGGGDIDVIE